MTGFIRRAVVRALALLVLLAAVGGVPAALVLLVGWPLPTSVPTAAAVTGWLSAPIGNGFIVDLLAVAAWLLWAAFVPAVASEIVAAVRGLPSTPHYRSSRSGNPLRVAAAGLITAITMGTLPSLAATGAPLAAPAPLAATQQENARPAHLVLVAQSTPAPSGKATIHVGQRRYSVTVEPSDTLSGIAGQWLGNRDRWPEICELNWHRHWHGVGGRMTDCDLIYPGWDLRLPPDAKPPSHAAPAPPDTTPKPTPRPSVTAEPPPAHRPDLPHQPTPPRPSAPSATAALTPVPATSGTSPSALPPSPLPATTPPQIASTTEPTTQPTSKAPPAKTARPSTGPSTAAPSAASPSASEASTSTTEHDGGTTTSTVAAGGHDQEPDGSGEDVAGPAASPQDDGVRLPGGFLPWELAGAIAAAVALVWLQRRRRHQPGRPDDDPADLPATVLDVQQAVSNHLPTQRGDLADRAADVPSLPVPPPGGVGLTGPGAHAAARAALVAMLASGGPRDPDAQGEVIIDGSTLTTLIGADAAALGLWPRLYVADDLADALTSVETRLMHRSRILDEHDVRDLDQLRQQAPDEEALPPVLLITETPPPGARMRTRTTLGLGDSLDVAAILLGEWEHGTTLHISDDGHATPPDTALGEAPAILDADTAVAILTTLREAQTGERPAVTLTHDEPRHGSRHDTRDEASAAHSDRPATSPPQGSARPSPAEQADDRDQNNLDDHYQDDHDENHQYEGDRGRTDGLDKNEVSAGPEFFPVDGQPVPAAGDGSDITSDPAVPQETPSGVVIGGKAQLRVLGDPHVEDLALPGRALRSKAAELAVFLACHPDGADTRTIGDHLEIGVRRRSADVRVHTNASNLRHVLGRAAGSRKSGYVTKHAGRYRLDPAAVEVDLWQLRDLLQRATAATGPVRIQLLRDACALYSGPLAESCDYDWVEPHRERARQEALDAHHLLAEDLLATDPQEASDVLDRAISIDRYNEAIYRQAMHARHRIGDTDGIRALMRALTAALADLDAEPEEETVALARQLRGTPK